MRDQNAPLGANADLRSFLDPVYGNVNLLYAVEMENEEVKGHKRIDQEPASSCITYTLCILTSNLIEREKKGIAEKILGVPPRKKPRFNYLENSKTRYSSCWNS